MTHFEPLVGKLLIAMPNLMDPNFWRSVVLLGVHSQEEGAFGLVVNRPLDINMEDVLQELEQKSTLKGLPQVLSGGPVEPEHGFVLFEQNDAHSEEEALKISDEITVSGSTQTLGRLVKGEIPGRFYLLLGYAGWHPGQLEVEIEENSWLVAPMDTDILFEVPIEDRWSAALASIGVDPGALVDVGGGSTPS